MYSNRIKIFIAFSLLLLSACIGRLVQMQLITASAVQDDIAELKSRFGESQQLKTLRGSILDRSGRPLAFDEPKFRLNIDYSLCCYWDPRIQMCKKLLAEKRDNPEEAKEKVEDEIHEKIEDIKLIINKCGNFGFETYEIERRLQEINDYVWDMKAYLAWKWSYPDQDFEQAVPDANERALLAYNADIVEMYDSYSLFDLETDDDIFAAQVEFLNIGDIKILPKVQRAYPYGSVASQIIGWIGPAVVQQDVELFADDKLMSYQSGELCGREDGVEYVCEALLRGSRGEELYDIDKNLISRTEAHFGRDVILTLDIELQERIENYLLHYNHESGCGPGMSVVIIDVASAEILAMVSLPTYDLNRARYDYKKLAFEDANKPLINRAINSDIYPPGSVVKPLILIAGMETGTITADEVISCPSEAAPSGWPNCWIYKDNYLGHDTKWLNNARNAIKGSCNIYFSHLADRMDSKLLQRWLLEFGYGQKTLAAPDSLLETKYLRNFRQIAGIISSTTPTKEQTESMTIPVLYDRQKRLFGMGQGNLRVTPLQVANSMATIARRGMIMQPRLFREMQESSTISMGLSDKTLETVYDGMSAVVNETGGTAYSEFSQSLRSFAQQDVKIFGKTGSTQGEEHAWFAGFAQDSQDNKIAIAVVVEGGAHGSRDAAPLARDIIQYCIEAGYLGKAL